MTRWYPVDPTSKLEQTHPGPRYQTHPEHDISDALRVWLKTKDPREALGVILLAQYDDGFAVQYLGAELIDADELIRRVVWIGDAMREASGPH